MHEYFIHNEGASDETKRARKVSSLPNISCEKLISETYLSFRIISFSFFYIIHNSFFFLNILYLFFNHFLLSKKLYNSLKNNCGSNPKQIKFMITKH